MPDIVVAHSGLEIYSTNNWNDTQAKITIFYNTGDWVQTSNGLDVHQTIDFDDPLNPNMISAIFDVALVGVDGNGTLDLFATSGDGDDDPNNESFEGIRVYLYNDGFGDIVTSNHEPDTLSATDDGSISVLINRLISKIE
jgi:hypothetical protein